MDRFYTESWMGEEDGAEIVPTEGSINCFLDEAEVYSPTECDRFRLSSQEHLNVLYERMRKKLSYHFMNPMEKWKAKRRFPWKLCLQVVKIVFVTYQMSLFGLRSHGYVQQHKDVTMTLGHIFLLDWSPDQTVYPPSAGPYAVYTKQEFFANLDYAVNQYGRIKDIALGAVSYDSPNDTTTPMNLCFRHYKRSFIFPANATISVDNTIVEDCYDIPRNATTDNFSIETFLQTTNITLKFPTLVEAKLVFHLRAVLPKSMNSLDVPECYRFQVVINYDNQHHDGQMTVTLTIYSEKLHCYFDMVHVDGSENRDYVLRQILNSIVILFCIASVVLCSRSLYSGQKLRREAAVFFNVHFDRTLSSTEHMGFVDFWFVLMIFSDVFIVCGSIIKIQIEEQHHGGKLYTECSLFLGVGNLFVWMGLLRYLSFFKKYNMLILTLKCALPNVLRFLLCAVLLYAGFCFCGWIVLGPYHVKFQSLSRTSECLFSVMNGDDMFATFILLGVDDPIIWWFSRIYLYLFLVLFVYVVISLFISVIMDTFETIKHLYIHGTPPKTTVELFLSASLPRPMTPPSPPDGDEASRSLTAVKAFFAEVIHRLQSL